LAVLADDGTIYLNNAGTTWPKPEVVYEAVQRAHRDGPRRSAEILADAGDLVSGFLGTEDPTRWIFTSSCTAALSTAIHDLPWNTGDAIVTSHLEHAAVVRPIARLVRERGVRHEVAPYTAGLPIDLNFVEAVLRKGSVRLIACSMASNVTGEILPSRELVQLAHAHGALCLLDGAQAVGLMPVDLGVLDADLFAFAGHKAPLGPLGIAGLWVGARVGGGGGLTLPGYCDVGSVNFPALAGLAAGLRWLQGQGVESQGQHARSLAGEMRAGLAGLPGVRLFGADDPASSTATLSIGFHGIEPSKAGSLLEERGFITRAGQHCAPLAHRALGTHETGTLRLSCGPWTTAEQIAAVVSAIGEITAMA
jgi:selenocysteine lyase/cysteine desulfurase